MVCFNIEFLVWKDCEEQRTNSKYSQKTGSWSTAGCKKIKYWCHRAGYIRNRCANPEKRQRALKRKGSCKISMFFLNIYVLSIRIV